MANLFLPLAAPVGNGTGAAVDTSAQGGIKTITVQGAFRGSVVIEFSNEGAAGPWAQACVFTNPGEQVIMFAAQFMRVRRSGVPDIAPGLPVVAVSANDIGALFADLPATAGGGSGAAVDVSALGTFNTVTVLGAFKGTVTIEISEDNVVWSQIMTFTKPGWQSKLFTAQWMRVTRAPLSTGTVNIDVGATNDSGSGGGGTDGQAALIFQPGGAQTGPVVFNDFDDLYAQLQVLRAAANGSGLYTIAFDNEFVTPVVVPANTYDFSGCKWTAFVDPTSSFSSLVIVNLSDGCVLQNLYDYDGPIRVVSLGTVVSPVTLANNELYFIRNRADIRAGAAAPFFDGSALLNPSAVTFDLTGAVNLGDGVNDVIAFSVVGSVCFIGLGAQATIGSGALNFAATVGLALTYRSTSASVSGTQAAFLGTLSVTDLVVPRARVVNSSAASVNAAFGDMIGSTPPGGAQTINLPLITPWSAGQPVMVKRLATANVLTVAPQAGQTIDGAASVTLTGLESVTFTADGVTNWRMTALYSGLDAGGVGESALIFQPGGAQTGPVVFNSWASLYAALQDLRAAANSDGLYTIIFDDSLGAVTVGPAAVYSMARCRWLSTQEGVGGNQVPVTITDGVTLPGLKNFQGNLQVSHAGATSPVALADGDLIQIYDGATVRSTGAAPFFSGAALAGGEVAIFKIDCVGTFGDGTNDVVSIPAGAIGVLSLGSQAEVLANALNVNAAGFLSIIWRNSSANVSGTQPQMLGTMIETDLVVPRGRIRSTTAASLAAAFGDNIGCTPPGGGQTINLPTITVFSSGQPVTVKRLNAANVLTVAPAGGQTIDGAASVTLTDLNGVTFVADGATNWRMVANFTGQGGTGVFSQINMTADGAVGTPVIARSTDLNTGIWFPGADLFAIAAGGVEGVRWNVSGQSLHPLGAVGLPTMSIAGDPNTGIWSPGADLLAVAANGLEVVRWNAQQQALYQLGTVALPPISFSGDPNTGFWSPSADIVAVTAGGVEATRWNASGQTLLPSGAAGTPSLGFTGDTDTGFYLAAGNTIGFSGAGGLIAQWSNNQLNINNGGSTAVAAIVFGSDTNTGLFAPGADLFAITAGGTEAVRWNISGQSLHPLGTAALPSMSISGDPNTGIYSPTADQLAVATAGAVKLLVTTTAVDVALGNGSAGTPALIINGDVDTGFFKPGANLIAVSASSIEAVRWNSNGQSLLTDGSAALPAIGFTSNVDCGLFFTANTLNFDINSTVVAQMIAAGVDISIAGAVGTPSLRWAGDVNSGFWQPGADLLAVSAGGNEIQRWGATTLSFFASAAVVKQTSGANLTNNVTAGGTDDTIANYTDLTVYATDAAAIRNNIYQLARKLKQINDGLRSYGLFT